MDTDSRRTPPATGNDVGSTTLINAVIGAVAGVLLSFVPFSTLLGGAIAGYLEGGETGDGAKVGAIAGVIMFVPFVLLGFVALFVLELVGAPALFGVVALFLVFLGAIYTIGAGAVGGVLGIYLKDEFGR